jgi:hypothetical protein
MLFTGLPLTAHEALQTGLISKVTSQENLGMKTKYNGTDYGCSFCFLGFAVNMTELTG